MENQFKQLCACLAELSKIEDIIEANKLSFVEVKAMMDLIDVKRKGFLDLNGIFELVGKVTEKELFDIFKWLDRNRTGEIKTEELQMALGNPDLNTKNTTKEYIFPRFYQMIDTVKDKPKTIAQIKQKYPFDSNSLKAIYQYICGLVQSKYLSQEELVSVFKTQFIKNSLKWSLGCESILKQLFPSQNISEGKFVDSFSSKGTFVEEDDEDSMMKGTADNTFNKSQSAYAKHKINQYSYSLPTKQKSPSFSRKINNFLDSPEFKSYPNEEKVNRTPSSNEKSQYKTNFDQIENSISSVLENIQQRRDKLRQDSQERKRLIEDVMQRKKQLYNSNDRSDNGFEWNIQRQQNQRNASTTNVKKVAKSYLNHQPTFYQNTNSYSSTVAEQKQLYRKNVYDNNVKESSIHSYERACGHIKSALTPNFSPYEPQKRQSTPTANTQISQILQKYSSPISDQDDNESTLKLLCKSKSGFMHQNTSHIRQSPKYYQPRQQQYEHYGLLRGGLSNSASKLKDSSYKENVMKRAEEEAAKKIEQIERKARMKVLEKKGGFRNKQEVEWNRLARHNY